LTCKKQDKGRHFSAGFVSGIGSAVALQPLDLLKTRAQQAGSGHSFRASLRSVLYAADGKLAPLALWKGTIPSTLRTGFGSALYFSLLNTLRHQSLRIPGLRDHDRRRGHSSQLPVLSPTANLVTGASARTLAGLVLMPLTIIKVRFESNLYSYRSLWEATRDIYAGNGLRGFFSGFGVTAIRDGPYAGLYVVFYEGLKKHLSNISATHWTSGQPGIGRGDKSADGKMAVPGATAINFTSAIFAGGACSLVSNPFDVVKTRIQLEPQAYKNMAQAARNMLASEGIRPLFDGLLLRMTRKALSSAIAWTVYEELVRTRHSQASG